MPEDIRFWVQLIVTLSATAAVFGALQNKLAHLGKVVDSLDAKQDRQTEQIHELVVSTTRIDARMDALEDRQQDTVRHRPLVLPAALSTPKK